MGRNWTFNYHYSKQTNKEERKSSINASKRSRRDFRVRLSNFHGNQFQNYRNQKYDMVWWFTVQIFLVACQLGVGQMEILDWTEVGEWGWESKIWKSFLFPSHRHDRDLWMKLSWSLRRLGRFFCWLKPWLSHQGYLCL